MLDNEPGAANSPAPGNDAAGSEPAATTDNTGASSTRFHLAVGARPSGNHSVSSGAVGSKKNGPANSNHVATGPPGQEPGARHQVGLSDAQERDQ